MYQLSAIERLLDVALRKPHGTYDEFAPVILELKLETDRIMQELKQILCTKTEREDFIQRHQLELLLMMESVAVHVPEEELQTIRQFSPVFKLSDGYKAIYNCLEELLIFIESHFGAFLSINYHIPSSYLIKAKQAFKTDLKFIEDRLPEILMDPFCNFLSTKKITYRQLGYLKEMKDALMAFYIEDKTDNLWYLMVSLNYNYDKYYDFVTASIESEIEGMPTYQQLDHLHYLQKRLNQQPVKAGCVFIPSEPSLKELLQIWLTSEIAYLSRPVSPEKQTLIPADLLKWLNFKLYIDGSVHELGYVIGLLLEKEIITNKNKTQVADFFAHFVSTTKQDTLAKGSLRRKLYNGSSAIAESVREGMRNLVKFSQMNAFFFFFFILLDL
jgi:hypothetical protein